MTNEVWANSFFIIWFFKKEEWNLTLGNTITTFQKESAMPVSPLWAGHFASSFDLWKLLALWKSFCVKVPGHLQHIFSKAQFNFFSCLLCAFHNEFFGECPFPAHTINTLWRPLSQLTFWTKGLRWREFVFQDSNLIKSKIEFLLRAAATIPNTH